MAAPKYLHLDTLSLHAGQQPDPTTGARAVPIFQSTSFVFRDTDHAAALFNMERAGHVYSRISNPTNAVLEERMAALEGGVGSIAVASGQAALHLAIVTLMGAGAHIVSSRALYGGSHNLLAYTLPRFGIELTLIGGPGEVIESWVQGAPDVQFTRSDAFPAWGEQRGLREAAVRPPRRQADVAAAQPHPGHVDDAAVDHGHVGAGDEQVRGGVPRLRRVEHDRAGCEVLRPEQRVGGRGEQHDDIARAHVAQVGGDRRRDAPADLARLVPEQFGLDQRFGQRRAVEHDHRLSPARRQAVQALGDQFLAGAALADHQHRPIERGGAAGAFERIEKGGRFPDEIRFALHSRYLANFTTF